MRKTIPEKKITICDGCKSECTHSTARKSAHLKVQQSVLDWSNTPCANGDVEYDFCDECIGKVFAAINETLTSIANP